MTNFKKIIFEPIENIEPYFLIEVYGDLNDGDYVLESSTIKLSEITDNEIAEIIELLDIMSKFDSQSLYDDKNGFDNEKGIYNAISEEDVDFIQSFVDIPCDYNCGYVAHTINYQIFFFDENSKKYSVKKVD